MPQQNSFQLRRLVAASVLTFTAMTSHAMGNKPVVDDEAVLARIQPVARVELAASATAATGARTGEEIVNGICGACHTAGVAGAPKIGDRAAWAPRLGQGLNGLVKSATAGKNAMPPKGGAELSAAELTSAVVFMTNKSGASFKETAGKK